MCAQSKADSCQVWGRLISFVFRTVSSIYPFSAEAGKRGGGVSEGFLLWRAEPDMPGPIPTEVAFIIRPTHSVVQVITFSVALSSSEETGFPKRANGQRMDTVWDCSNQQEHQEQNICSSDMNKNIATFQKKKKFFGNCVMHLLFRV